MATELMGTERRLRPVPRFESDSEWALWLVQEHERLGRLVERVGYYSLGVLDVDGLANAINEWDEHVPKWQDYERLHPAPNDDDRYDQWRDQGPQATADAHLIAVLSSGEQRQLRLLAFLSSRRVGLRIGDLDGVDQDVVTDWMLVIRHRGF